MPGAPHGPSPSKRLPARWPWLTQPGYGRAGWYSYDWRGNDGQPGAGQVGPGWGQLSPCDPVRMMPASGLDVVQVEDGHYFVARTPDLTMSWCLDLEPLNQQSCRLISRWRDKWFAVPASAPWIALSDPGSFSTDHRMLFKTKDASRARGAAWTRPTLSRRGGEPAHQAVTPPLPPAAAMAWQHVEEPEKVQSWFLRDTPGFQIVPDLSPRADEAIFDKLAMSAFAGTPKEMALRDLGIRTFAIGGVALEIGIAPIIRHAVDLGLIPVVVTDACGGRDRPAMQRVLDSIRCSGDALLTDIVTITPLLASTSSR